MANVEQDEAKIQKLMKWETWGMRGIILVVCLVVWLVSRSNREDTIEGKAVNFAEDMKRATAMSVVDGSSIEETYAEYQKWLETLSEEDREKAEEAFEKERNSAVSMIGMGW